MRKVERNLHTMLRAKSHFSVRRSALARCIAEAKRHREEEFDPDDIESWQQINMTLTDVLADIEDYITNIEDEVEKVRSGIERLNELTDEAGIKALTIYMEEDTALSIRNIAHAQKGYNDIIEKYVELSRMLRE